jgi:serine/threonine protein kinase
LDTLVGTSIGGYTLVKLLGAGGMGSVYLANDPTIGQQVAVKVIRTDLDAYADSASARMALERFRQEARAVASLDHLHILPLYRYGEEETPHGPRSYMIMQYRPEGSLWDWLRRRADLAAGTARPTQSELSSGLPTNWPLGLEEAAEYVQQAASALQYAHDRGIVHRDVKPANFLLRIDLHEKSVHLLLSDFGLAKVFTSSSATNTILGTPTYMAPEQFEGAARPESDQYALAIMIYYLLAGRPPFEGDPMQLMRQHLSAEVPSIVAFNPNVPPALNGIFARAMAKQPEQRFPSVASFAEAFARVAKEPASSISMLGTRPAARSGLLNPPSSTPVAQRSPAPLILPGTPEPAPGVYPTPSPPPAVYPTPSPNPRLAGGMYGAQPPYAGPTQMYAPASGPMYAPPPMVTPGYPLPLPGEQGGQKVSRRGALGWLLGVTTLAVAGAGAATYFYLNKSGSTGQSGPALHTLTGHSASVTSLSWLPGGTQLASGSADSTVRLWSAADGSQTSTITASSVVRAVAWSPDGNTLAAGEDNRSIELWNASGSLVKRASLWGASVRALAWRDNTFLFLGTYGTGLHAYDLANDKRYGRNNAIHVDSITPSPDGHYLAVALAGGTVYFADLTRNWAEVTTLPASHGAAYAVAWSPDGSLVAVGYADGQIVVYNATTQRESFTLKHNGAVNSVAWHPNSSVPVLASGSSDSTVGIWQLGSTKATQNAILYHSHKDEVLAVAWSSNLLASGSKDKTVILWQPPSWALS